MPRPVRRLGSVRLTFLLLLVLAAATAVGTAVPQNLDPAEYARRFPTLAPAIDTLGLDHFYTGPLVRGLLGVLTANLLACGVRRSVAGVRAFFARSRPTVTLPLHDRQAWIERLEGRGFRVAGRAPLTAWRRRWAFLGFPLVHLAIPVIMAGALGGSLAGFVGTQSIRVGEATGICYDWSAGAERPLPFVLALDDLRVLHYPTLLELGVTPPGGAPRTLTVREGTTVGLDGTPYAVVLGSFDIDTGNLTFWVDGPGGRSGPFDRTTHSDSPVAVQPLRYRDPEVRRAEARVTARTADGTVTATAVVAVNQPLVVNGVRVFLTAWGDDSEGAPFAGFQFTRDPGQPLVWAGSTALALGLFVMLFAEGAWARETNGRLLLASTRRHQGLGELIPPPDG